MVGNSETGRRTYADALQERVVDKQTQRTLRGVEGGRARLDSIKQALAGVQKFIEDSMVVLLSTPDLLLDDLESVYLNLLERATAFAQWATTIDDRAAESFDRLSTSLLGEIEAMIHTARARSTESAVRRKGASMAGYEVRVKGKINLLQKSLTAVTALVERLESSLESSEADYHSKLESHLDEESALIDQAFELREEAQRRKGNGQSLQGTRRRIKKVIRA